MHDLSPRSHLARLAPIALLALVVGCQSQNPPVGPTPDTGSTSTPASPSAAAPASAAASAIAPAAVPAPVVPAPKSLWSVQTQGKTASIVDVAGERVYAVAGNYLEFGSPTRYVMALEASSGRVVWSKDMGETIFPESFVADGLFVLTSDKGKRTVLDAEKGAPSPKKPPKEAPKKEAGALDCKQETKKLACKGKDGAALWQIDVEEPISRLTQPAGRVCFARSRVLTIECRDAATGAVQWSHAVPRLSNIAEPNEVHFDYKIDGGRVYIANYDGTITALEIPKP